MNSTKQTTVSLDELMAFDDEQIDAPVIRRGTSKRERRFGDANSRAKAYGNRSKNDRNYR